jgi:hypothetical protein
MRFVLFLRSMALAALTPLLEKNVAKTFAVDVPLVFSMGRVVVLAFCIGMLRHIWQASVIGWPDATLAMAVVLALPVFSALDRVAPDRVVDLAVAARRAARRNHVALRRLIVRPLVAAVVR